MSLVNRKMIQWTSTLSNTINLLGPCKHKVDPRRVLCRDKGGTYVSAACVKHSEVMRFENLIKFSSFTVY